MRRLLLLVSAIVLVDTMFFSAVTPLLPHYREELDLSKAGAGVLSASYAVGVLAASIPSGMLASRLGVKPTVLLGLAVMSAMSIVFGLAHSIWLLDGARFTQGAGSACSWAGGLAWLVAAAPRSRRGELIGIAIGAAIGGALLGPVLGGAASATGTGPAFAAVAVLGGVLAAFAIATPGIVPGDRQPVRALFGALRAPRVVGGLWFIALPGLLFGTLGVLAPLRLHELGFGGVAIGAVFLVSAALEASLSPIMGRWSDRRGRLLPVRIGLVASVAVLATLPWVGERWTLAVVVIAAAMAYGVFWAPGMALLSDGAEDAGLDQALGFALMNLAWAPGAATGSAAGGALAQATGDAVPYLTLAGICLLTLLVVASRSSDLGTRVPAWRSESSS